MKIRFWGAAGEVTGSCFVVEADGERIMIDCGMFQGQDSDEKNRREVEGNLKGLEGVILTHAHLDHCGRLPILWKGGYRGKIWATPPTEDLTRLVLEDAAKIAELNEEGLEPLYHKGDVAQTMDLFETITYRKWFKLGSKFEARFLDAGHILGSAMVELKVKEGEEEKMVVFSGDMGNSPSPLVKEMEVPEKADLVVMESTYGNRLHKPRGEEIDQLWKWSSEIMRERSVMMIASFALERAQELLFAFDQIKKKDPSLKEMPVFLDSPMAIKATDIFKKHRGYLNEERRQQFKNDDPFDFGGFKNLEWGRESRKVRDRLDPRVIIAGAGMMSGGRILSHAKRWLGNKKAMLVLTGYQAEGTLGREIQEGAKAVVIDDKPVVINAQVKEISTMSAHADQEQMLDWLNGIEGVERVVLVHGEEEGRDGLEEELKGKMKIERPLWGEEIKS